MQRDKCRCKSELAMLEIVKSITDQIINELVETFENSCPEFYEVVADHLVAKIVHTVVLVRDPDVRDADVPNEVHRVVGEMQGKLPALLVKIITDHEAKKENRSACH